MPQAPTTPKKEYFHEEQGVRRSDPYHWLRDKESPEVVSHLQAENDYTNALLSPNYALKQTIYQETLSRIQETDQDYPWAYGMYEYYFRTQEGLQYDIFCRRPKGGGPEEILFDENLHAAEHEFFEVGQYALNMTQDVIAITLDTTGNERYDIYLLNLSTGTLKKEVTDVSSNVLFSTNNRDICFTRYDETQRPFQVWCHDTESQLPDALLYEEKNEQFTVSMYRSMSDRYLIIHIASKLTSEVHLTEASTPRAPLRLFLARKHLHEYDIDHQGDYFYIRTNQDGRSFSLKRCPLNDYALSAWETVIPVDPNIPLDGFSVFSDHIVLECRRDGLSQMAVLRTRDMKHDWLIFDEPAYTVQLGENWEYNTQSIRVIYVSMTTPACDYLFDLNTLEKTLLKQSPVLGDFNSAHYKTERIFATADDGTQIPISLVYRLPLSSVAPMLLTGYGAYGIDSDPYFSYSRLSLLDRGFIYAVAHVRGGGEYGDAWHEAGRFLHKKNTFTDFIACAKHLIHESYTSSDKLMISGGSAGGLLIGAVLNIEPTLFKAAVAHVPFVDVVNTMMDETLPLTALEYEEWGNPHEKVYYDYIFSYAPYENVTAQAYPTLFATAGLHDPRVPYWEAAKWVARLREHQTNDAPLMLRVQMSAGHQGPSGRYHAIEEVAEEFAFLVGLV